MENKPEAAAVTNAPNNIFDVFIEGARKGLHIGINNMLPNIIMAYVIAYILEALGIMKFLGDVLGPVMGIWGLPGQAFVVLLTAWLSSSAGVGVATALFISGTLSPQGITIMMPAFYLLGSQLQYMGRLLGTADVPKKYWPLLMLTSILNTAASMFVMKLILAFF